MGSCDACISGLLNVSIHNRRAWQLRMFDDMIFGWVFVIFTFFYFDKNRTSFNKFSLWIGTENCNSKNKFLFVFLSALSLPFNLVLIWNFYFKSFSCWLRMASENASGISSKGLNRSTSCQSNFNVPTCFCGERAQLTTAWKGDYPERRFYGCVGYVSIFLSF